MQIRRPIVFLLLAGFLALSTHGFGDDSLHGVRNKKCQPDEQEAKTAIFELLRTVKELCPMGSIATQADGWTCRKGDCPKGKIRCNTQYRCGNGDIPQMPAQAPAQMPAQQMAQPKPQPQAQPQPQPAAAAPGKREFTENGVSYIEETTVDAKGIATTSTYPKGEIEKNNQPELVVPAPPPAEAGSPNGAVLMSP